MLVVFVIPPLGLLCYLLARMSSNGGTVLMVVGDRRRNAEQQGGKASVNNIHCSL